MYTNGLLLSHEKKYHNKVMIHTTTSMNLEDIMLSQTRQTQKDKHCMIPLTRGTQNRQIHTDKKQSRGYSAGRWGEWSDFLMLAVSIWPNEKVLEIDSGHVCDDILSAITASELCT